MIEGTNFYEIRSVAFGSKPATSFTVNSPTSITAIAPSGSGTADLTVTGGGGTISPVFSYAPNVTTVTPAHGPVRGGNQVTITGTDFREVTSVAFGPHNATSFTVKSPTSITAIAPAGSGRVSVTITTVGDPAKQPRRSIPVRASRTARQRLGRKRTWAARRRAHADGLS